MVLIEVHKPDGSFVGRCDARCYNAKHPECDCICGGANHGKGWAGIRPIEVSKKLKGEHPENIVTNFGIQQNLFGGN